MALDADSKTVLLRAYQHVQRFSAMIIGVDEFGDTTTLGAGGSFVRRGRNVLLATAGHVVSHNFDFPAVGFFYATKTELTRTAYKNLWTAQRGGRGHVDEEWDIACAGLHPKLLGDIGREALPLDRCDRAWLAKPGTIVLLQGASKDLITRGVHADGLPTQTLIENFVLARVMDPARVKGATFREGVDIFLEHDPTTMSFEDVEQATPTAIGMSGGGVWAINRTKDRTWSETDITLVGIVRTSLEHPNHRWIRATKVAHWMDFMNACVWKMATTPG